MSDDITPTTFDVCYRRDEQVWYWSLPGREEHGPFASKREARVNMKSRVVAINHDPVVLPESPAEAFGMGYKSGLIRGRKTKGRKTNGHG